MFMFQSFNPIGCKQHTTCSSGEMRTRRCQSSSSSFLFISNKIHRLSLWQTMFQLGFWGHLSTYTSNIASIWATGLHHLYEQLPNQRASCCCGFVPYLNGKTAKERAGVCGITTCCMRLEIEGPLLQFLGWLKSKYPGLSLRRTLKAN